MSKKKWFRRQWHLYAKFKKYDYTGIETYCKLIGTYKSELDVSFALTRARKALGIESTDKSYASIIEDCLSQQ